MKQYSILVFLCLLGAGQVLSQSVEMIKTHHLGFGLQYHQIKESSNYGLVNQGLNLSINYDYQKMNNNRLFSYNPIIAFGPNYRYGLGLNWHFKLVDLFYGFRTSKKEDRSVFIGFYGAVNNLWQLYPELQSGHMFWFTTIEMGPKFQGSYTLGERELAVKASISMYGFTSRPDVGTEEYFYSLKLADVISDSFSNIQFGSYNRFNHTFIEIDYANPLRNKLILGYAFEYFGYYDEPTFGYMTHSIVLKWKLGK